MATTAALWQPQEEGLREICALLEAHISPTSDQARIWQQLQHYAQFPDFNNYLVFLLVRAQALYMSMDQCLQGLLSLVNDPLADVRKPIGKEISPVVITVVSCLVPILTNPETLNKSLTENSAITPGMLSWVCPDIVAPLIWNISCKHGSMPCAYDFEKEDAFHGLCAMVAANPTGAVSSLSYIFQACASWNEIKSEGLHNEVSQILNGYKQVARNCWLGAVHVHPRTSKIRGVMKPRDQTAESVRVYYG